MQKLISIGIFLTILYSTKFFIVILIVQVGYFLLLMEINFCRPTSGSDIICDSDWWSVVYHTLEFGRFRSPGWSCVSFWQLHDVCSWFWCIL